LIFILAFLKCVRPCEAFDSTLRLNTTNKDLRDSVNYKYPKCTPVQIDSDKLSSCLTMLTRIKFTDYYSEPQEMKTERFTGQSGNLRKEPEFWSYLAARPGRKSEYISGKEDDLKAWVLAQPDNSVDILKIYEASMRLNHGNIWNAILTIHGISRNLARAYDRPRYVYQTDNREVENFFNKFIDISGDLRECGPSFHGDHKGRWYRIWAGMLFRMDYNSTGFFRLSSSDRSISCSNSKPVSDTWLNGFLPLFEVSADQVMNRYVTPTESDARKGEYNRNGVDTVSKLFKGLRSSPQVSEALYNSQCSNRQYLIPKP
jgi:hypothetical protein